MLGTSDEKTPIRVISKTIRAADFNRVRLALRWLGQPLRVELSAHRGLQVILNNELWLCVDAPRDDQRVLAWRAFDTVERSGLHEDVSCELCLYHLQAGLIMGTALEQLGQSLEQHLAAFKQAEMGTEISQISA